LIQALCATSLLSLLAWQAVAQSAMPQPANPQPGSLRMPVASGCLSSPFGPRHAVGPRAPAAFHTGVDLPAPAGGKVFAVAPGQVMGIHKRGPGGLEVVVRHDGFTAIYSHLGRVTPALAEGRGKLAAGEELGVVGRTGVTYGTHLFFEVIVDGKPVDPAPLLGAGFCPAAKTTR
jgi:murein DD-endopeptidase MepM/ murein hydrolase activator NlpD